MYEKKGAKNYYSHGIYTKMYIWRIKNMSKPMDFFFKFFDKQTANEHFLYDVIKELSEKYIRMNEKLDLIIIELKKAQNDR